jgi:hypothetical protein
MDLTPRFDELKEECDLNRLEHCFRLFFMQQVAVNDGLITLLEEECQAVRLRMQRQHELL